MRSLGVIDLPGIKHIWLVGDRDAMVHETKAIPHPELRSCAASRRMGDIGAAWFETREDALLSMRAEGALVARK
jgi:hypothetical protein